jgi:16S rRNA C967 or C1407 C5-methylase (RsmB/RsmF family)/NOL1/NOP2/fmu family ribosome biogenesis protein
MNWPAEFLKRMQNYFGEDYPIFLKGLSEPSPVSIRLNESKMIEPPINSTQIPWSRSGYYLSARPSFTLDPLFHAGCYYVQEAGSQFIEQLFLQAISEIENPVVLDLCAAPGGKSTHLLSLLAGKGLLVSNEIISSRNKILQQNIAQWGYLNSIVTQNDAADFANAGELFDVIVVDAPCSGEGLFRRDPDASNEWSESAVENCRIRQSDILQNMHHALKSGGYLIYSTCTFETSENEDQIKRMIEEFGYEKVNVVAAHDGIKKSEWGYHFYPHATKSEGFFVSMLRKPSETNNIRIKEEKVRVTDKKSLAIVEDYFSESSKLAPIEKDDRLYVLPALWYSHFVYLSKKLFIRQTGIFMGTKKDKNFIPSQELALSIDLKKDLPSVNVNLETALNYLRCENINLPDAPIGWTLICFQNYFLGWVKVLDRRVNNYYPKEWRILKK